MLISLRRSRRIRSVIEPTTLARPYARAAFEHARAPIELAAWQTALSQLAAITTDAKVAALLRDPNQTAAQRASPHWRLWPARLAEPWAILLAIMADNGRLALYRKWPLLFEQLKQAVESAVAVHVSSAYPLSDAETQTTRRYDAGKARAQHHPDIRN